MVEQKTIYDFLASCRWRYRFDSWYQQSGVGWFTLFYRDIFIGMYYADKSIVYWNSDDISKKYSQFTRLSKIDFKEKIEEAFFSVYGIRARNMIYNGRSWFNVNKVRWQ